jgi:hypothetical protein
MALAACGIALALASPAPVAAQTVDVRIQSTGGFVPTGSGGIISNTIGLSTTIQVPPSGEVEAGGSEGWTRTRSVTGAGAGAAASFDSASATGIGVRVIPVEVTAGFPPSGSIHGAPAAGPKGPLAASGRLPEAPVRQLVRALESDDPGTRGSALVEIGRHHASEGGSARLVHRVARLLGDPDWRVAALAARTLLRLADPATAEQRILPFLGSRDNDRLIAFLAALEQVGGTRSLPRVRELIDRVDLDVSTAAARTASAIESRGKARDRRRSAAVQRPPATLAR